jgi:signal transduction histidine kinase
VSPENLPHIFDRFWQATHGERTGAGLGLAIARGIVEAHHGTIRAHSEPGQGAEIVFELPVA